MALGQTNKALNELENSSMSRLDGTTGWPRSALTSGDSAAERDQFWMKRALDLAARAGAAGEIPVGAVVVCDGEIVGAAFNTRETALNPVGHAEILALQEASQRLGRWRLLGCTLYVTLEPCVMCAGALVNARVDRVVYGARDPKAGAVESVYSVLSDKRLNHLPAVVGGVCSSEASMQLKDFFRALRTRPMFR